MCNYSKWKPNVKVARHKCTHASTKSGNSAYNCWSGNSPSNSLLAAYLRWRRETIVRQWLTELNKCNLRPVSERDPWRVDWSKSSPISRVIEREVNFVGFINRRMTFWLKCSWPIYEQNFSSEDPHEGMPMDIWSERYHSQALQGRNVDALNQLQRSASQMVVR